jgi:hypothetical protein
MTDTKALAAPSLAELERALDEVVSAIVAYRQSPPDQVARALSGKDNKMRATDAAVLAETGFEVLRAISLAGSPVEKGLKHSIRELGMLIHALVGDDGMHEVAERVCGLDDANWSRRMAPLDSAWNGIGRWVS